MHKVDWPPNDILFSVTYMTVSRDLETGTGDFSVNQKVFLKDMKKKRRTCWKKGFRVLRRKT